MNKMVKLLFVSVLTGIIVTVNFSMVTPAVYANDGEVNQEFIAEQADFLTEEQLFSSEQISAWENDILNRANKERPVGDYKSYKSGQTSFRTAYGGWSWRDGVICITDSYAFSPLFNNGHAGIVAVAPYYNSTIEANLADGVQAKWGDWVSRFPNNNVYQYGVRRTSEAQDQQAAQWATNQIGKPYNTNFTNIWTRDRFYCSQLVWAAYKDTTGVDIGTWKWGIPIHPFELMDSKETVLMFRNK